MAPPAAASCVALLAAAASLLHASAIRDAFDADSVLNLEDYAVWAPWSRTAKKDKQRKRHGEPEPSGATSQHFQDSEDEPTHVFLDEPRATSSRRTSKNDGEHQFDPGSRAIVTTEPMSLCTILSFEKQGQWRVLLDNDEEKLVDAEHLDIHQVIQPDIT